MNSLQVKVLIKLQYLDNPEKAPEELRTTDSFDQHMMVVVSSGGVVWSLSCSSHLYVPHLLFPHAMDTPALT